MYHLGSRLKDLYRGSSDAKDRPIQDLTWDYPTVGPHEEPDAEAVLAEINGYRIADGSPISSFLELDADGSTACGCWIYAGCRADGVNQTARRKPGAEQSWVAPEWGWAWPANRRILYNRASADPGGTALVGTEALRMVGRDRRAVGRLTTTPTSSPTGSLVPTPRQGAEGIDADGRRSTPSSCRRTARLGCSPRRAEGRTAPHPLRARRGDRQEPVVRTAMQPCADGMAAEDEPVSRRVRRSSVPVRHHDLPAHRTSHRRRDVAAGSRGWPSCNRRCSVRSRPSSRRSRT